MPVSNTPSIRWVSSGHTDKGSVRPINEDAVLTLDDQHLWAVADGLGGHQIGKVASQKLITGLASVAHMERLCDCVDAIEDKLIDINDQLQRYSRDHIQGKKMGSTLVCLVIRQNVGVCFWVGDSRLYRLRGQQFKQLTRDHSLVEELIKRGMITREEAKTHPERNIITRAIGTDRELFVELSVFGVNAGDRYLLCSDGLYESVSSRDMLLRLSECDSVTASTRLLSQSLRNNAQDNVSLIVVDGLPAKTQSNSES